MHKIIGVVLALFLLVGLMPTGIVLAQETDSTTNVDHTVHANQSQLKLIQELYGTDITLGDYLRTVYPDQLKEMLKEITEDQLKTLLESKMEWAPLPSSPLAELDNKLEQDLSVKDVTISVEASHPSATVGSGEVDYSGEITTTPPTSMLYLSIGSYLYYWNGSDWDLKAACSNWNMFFTSCKCEGTYSTSANGYYINMASGSWNSIQYGSGNIIDWSNAIYLQP